MAHSKMIRNFIILQEDEKEQSVSKEKPLSGYAKIEAKADKCKISFYAQNVKKDDKNCFMTLICYKKDGKQIISIGELNIGTQGKCDTSVEFPIDDIAGLGVSADKIIGAAIYKEIMGKPVYLMYGFMNGQVPKEEWKKFELIGCGKEKLDSSIKEKLDIPIMEKLDRSEKVADVIKSAVKSGPKDTKVEKDLEIQELSNNENVVRTENQPIVECENVDVVRAHNDTPKTNYSTDSVKNSDKDQFNHEELRSVDDDYSIESRLDDDLLRNLKIKAITEEIEEFKDKIFSINRKNEETILNELNKFKETCLSQLGNVADVVTKPFTTDKKSGSNSQKRSSSIFDDYEKKIEESKYFTRQQFEEPYQLRGNVADYFEDVLSEYQEANDSINDIRYCRWYKVPVTSMQQMYGKNSVDKQKVVYNLMMNNYPYIIKHGHFLFGIKGDKDGKAKYLVYAVPGTKDEKDQPYGGKSGFVTWVQGKDKESNLGYWLLFYDYKNQIIAVPMK